MCNKKFLRRHLPSSCFAKVSICNPNWLRQKYFIIVGQYRNSSSTAEMMGLLVNLCISFLQFSSSPSFCFCGSLNHLPLSGNSPLSFGSHTIQELGWVSELRYPKLTIKHALVLPILQKKCTCISECITIFLYFPFQVSVNGQLI